MSAAKFVAALIGAVAMALVSVLTDGRVTSEEWVQVAIAAVTALSVWVAANVPSMPAAKSVVAALLAVLNLLVAYITNGVSAQEWANLVVAALTAAGVYVVPNGLAPPAATTP